MKQIPKIVIKENVLKHFKISEEEFLSKTRKREIMKTRQIYHYLCRKLTSSSLHSIARTTNQNHATVIHSITNVSNQKFLYKEVQNDLREITQNIENQTTRYRELVPTEVNLLKLCL